MTLPRWAAHAALGMVLALGAPAGMLVVRLAERGELSLDWLSAELLGDLLVYLYVWLSTTVVFAAFGAQLGAQADRLLALSYTDPLTGLFNRRAALERLASELARARRQAQPLSVLMIDVDQLKQVNDRFGHAAGDAALERVGSAIREGARASDSAARWGGDEFVLVAPDTATAAATALAERIRARVAAATSVLEVGVGTVSIGVTTLDPAQRGDSAELVAAADRALYVAKLSGGDAVSGELEKPLNRP